MEIKEIESALEAVLFASGDPISVDRLCKIVSIDQKTAGHVLVGLRDRCAFERRGYRLVSMDDRWQFVSAPEHAELVRKALEERRPPPLSKAALEVLAIVAYFQPTTKAYIEQTRGVDSSGTIASLSEKNLIAECGRLEVPGRPILYRTTPIFLRSFGLSSLEDLPDLPLGGEDGGGQLSFLPQTP
ncbi:MAG: SMC-Scp complex subunit ScpB [Oscillospiraceae bacterium]|nr:SMC-Scp complex subunit ScpB [Oscillospiraceae bacterium]